MELKLFEVRDRGTCIPVAAIRLTPADEVERWLVWLAGYGKSAQEQGEYVLLFRLDCAGHEIAADPYYWQGPRTLFEAHTYLQQYFAALSSGSVIDIEYLLGERKEPRDSDREADNGH